MIDVLGVNVICHRLHGPFLPRWRKRRCGDGVSFRPGWDPACAQEQGNGLPRPDGRPFPGPYDTDQLASEPRSEHTNSVSPEEIHRVTDDKSNPDPPLDPIGIIQAEWVSLHEMYRGARSGGFSWPSALGFVAWVAIINSGRRPEDAG